MSAAYLLECAVVASVVVVPAAVGLALGLLSNWLHRRGGVK